MQRTYKIRARTGRPNLPDTTTAEEIRQAITEAANFTGGAQERQVGVMCRQLGIDYTRLTPEEFQVMIRVLGKFAKIKSICSCGHIETELQKIYIMRGERE